jgi:hypothetical protein
MKSKINKKSKTNTNKKSKRKLRNMKGGMKGTVTLINDNLVFGVRNMTYIQNGIQGEKPTYFYFEKLSQDNIDFWYLFIKKQPKNEIGIINNRNQNKQKRIHSIDGYISLKKTLDLYRRGVDYIWIAYSSTQDLEKNTKKSILDWDNIEMAVSVFFRKDIPLTSHMGITRNYLFFSKDSPSTKNLAVFLHSFAAKSVLEICNNKKVISPKYMTTRPAKVMGNIILKQYASLDPSFTDNNPDFDNKDYYSANKIENIWVCDEQDRKKEYNIKMCIPKNDGSENMFPLKFIQEYNREHNNVYTELLDEEIKEADDLAYECSSEIKKYRSKLKSLNKSDPEYEQVKKKIDEFTRCEAERLEHFHKLLNKYTLLPRWEFKYEGQTYTFDIPPWYDINEVNSRITYHEDFMYTQLPNMIMDFNLLSSIF